MQKVRASGPASPLTPPPPPLPLQTPPATRASVARRPGLCVPARPARRKGPGRGRRGGARGAEARSGDGRRGRSLPAGLVPAAGPAARVAVSRLAGAEDVAGWASELARFRRAELCCGSVAAISKDGLCSERMPGIHLACACRGNGLETHAWPQPVQMKYSATPGAQC